MALTTTTNNQPSITGLGGRQTMTTINMTNVIATTRINIAHGESYLDLHTDGYSIMIKHASDETRLFSLMAYRSLRDAVAQEWRRTFLDTKALRTRGYEWSVQRSKQLMSSPTYLAWCEMVEAAPTQNRLLQTGFLSTLGRPMPYEWARRGSDIYRHPILAERHAARLLWSQSPYNRTRDFSQRWRTILDPKNTGYGALNKTLDAMPRGIAGNAIIFLRDRERLPRAITNRIQLLAYAHSGNPDLGHLIATSEPKSMQAAIALYAPNMTPRQQATPSGRDIENAVRHMQDELSLRNGKPYHNDTPLAIMRRALNNDQIGTWANVRKDQDYPGDDYEFARKAEWPLPEGIEFVSTPGQMIDLSCAEHHCVATYWRRAMTGEIEIYHAKHEGTTSTIGIQNGTHIYQNHGTNNEYTKASAWAAKTLRPLLNGTYKTTPTEDAPQPVPTEDAPQPVPTGNAPKPRKARKPQLRRTDFRNPEREHVKAEYDMRGWCDGKARKPLAAKYNDDYLESYIHAIAADDDYQAALLDTEAYLAKYWAEENIYHVGRPSATKHPLRWLCIWNMEREAGAKFQFRTKGEVKRRAEEEAQRVEALGPAYLARCDARINRAIDIRCVSEEYATEYLHHLRHTWQYTATLTAIHEGKINYHIEGYRADPAGDQAWYDYHNGLVSPETLANINRNIDATVAPVTFDDDGDMPF
jgi:hypothetical protein